MTSRAASISGVRLERGADFLKNGCYKKNVNNCGITKSVCFTDKFKGYLPVTIRQHLLVCPPAFQDSETENP